MEDRTKKKPNGVSELAAEAVSLAKRSWRDPELDQPGRMIQCISREAARGEKPPARRKTKKMPNEAPSQTMVKSRSTLWSPLPRFGGEG